MWNIAKVIQVVPKVVPKIGIRTLYHVSGLDTFNNNRARSQRFLGSRKEAFITRMNNLIEADSNETVLVDDFKDLIYTCENRPEDINLVYKVAKKHAKDTKSNVRFNAFSFGPELMRLFWYHNIPEMSLKLFEDAELSALFGQISSYALAMDMQFNLGNYEKVFEIMEKASHDNRLHVRYPMSCLTLAGASAYKLNTKESLEKCLEWLKGAQKEASDINERALGFIAALAFNLNMYDVTIEITKLARSSFILSMKNIKVMAFAKSGQIDNALYTLRDTQGSFASQRRMPHFFKSTFDILEKAVSESGNADQMQELKQLMSALEQSGLVDRNQTYEEFIMRPIEKMRRPPADRSQFGGGFERQGRYAGEYGGRDRYDRMDNRMDDRFSGYNREERYYPQYGRGERYDRYDNYGRNEQVDKAQFRNINKYGDEQ